MNSFRQFGVSSKKSTTLGYLSFFNKLKKDGYLNQYPWIAQELEIYYFYTGTGYLVSLKIYKY